MQIYLDYSATTMPRPEVIKAMELSQRQNWGNPSSLHTWGQKAAQAMEMARIQVAELINAPATAITFTSGGTEANNLAILGIAANYSQPQHLIISSVEHPAVKAPAQMLQKWGWQVTELPVNQQGRINPWELQAALQPNTVLVSVIYGQSEVGTIQPIQELAAIARTNKVIFHTDAVQAAGRIPLDLQKIPVDLLSLSSHKIYGPKGVGALYINPHVPLQPCLWGGGQEMGLRPGTQPVPSLVGFGVAASYAKQEMSSESERLKTLRERLFLRLVSCPYLIPTGDRLQRLPHHLSFILKPQLFPETVTGKTLVRELNLAGIGISSGSACQSGKLNPSPTLLAMGYSPPEALRGIRLTLGRETTAADVDWAAMALTQILERLQRQLVTIKS